MINSYGDGTSDWWGSRSDTASVCFGQAGVTNANATLVLNAGAAHVYDVRKGTYLGYGSQFNVTMPVYEGSVFALLPYQVDSLAVDLVQYDPMTQAATLTASVVPADGTAGNHVLRIEVFDAANVSLSHLNSKVVATNGTWTGVIPFAITDTVTDIRVHVTDVASDRLDRQDPDALQDRRQWRRRRGRGGPADLRGQLRADRGRSGLRPHL